jgi:alkylated DNA nucleotide flippase Atl1
VVGHGGRISLDGRPAGLVQRRRLRREGVRFVRGRVDIARHGLSA